MRKLFVLTFVSLDGVMQAPGGPDEDTSGGFTYGGWTFPYFDEFAGSIMGEQLSQPFDLLLGRKTYDIFAAYWPKQPPDGPIAAPFNKAHKYVVSHSDQNLSWVNSSLITGDVAGEIKKLKETDGPDLQVHGSGNLIQTLLQRDLIDQLWLKTFPVTLGKGKRLFAEGTIPGAWKLIESKTSPSGIIFASYERSGDVKTGSFV